MVANDDDGLIEWGRQVRRRRMTQVVVETHDIAHGGRIEGLGDRQLADLFPRAPEPRQHDVERFIRQPAAVDTCCTESRHTLLLTCGQEAIALTQGSTRMPPDAT